MSIRAVFFDLEGTLVERSLSDPEIFHKILHLVGEDVSLEKIRKAYSQVMEEFGDIFIELRGKIPRLEFHQLWSFHILGVLGIEDHKGDILRKINEQWVDLCGVKAQPDAKVTLISLRTKQLKVGIISGNYEEEIERMVEIGGIDKGFFDIIVGADTIKRRKPNPEIFRYALSKLGLKPQETIYVGDNLENDYIPAKSVGMHPFLIVRVEDTVLEGVREITSLLYLLHYLDTYEEEIYLLNVKEEK